MSDASLFSYHTEPTRDPGDLSKLVSAHPRTPAFYFEQPSRNLAIAGLGAAVEFRGSGPGRFTEASTAALSFLCSMNGGGADMAADGPLVVGGFGFSDYDTRQPQWRDFPATRLFVPKLLWVRRGSTCTLTTVSRTGLCGDDDPAHSPNSKGPELSRNGARAAPGHPANPEERHEWERRVERARSLIAAGKLRKVVLSRKLEVEFPEPIDPAAIVSAARDLRPACFTFWFRAGQSSLVGSTPELLARLENGRVTSDALAGSAPRGATEAEDRDFSASLFASAKELEEHELVVTAVRSALGKVAAPIDAPNGPGVMLLPEAQHLYTPIEGRLLHHATVIEIAGLLHPTPATCGVPLEAARAIIEREEADRGWYSGMIGWMNARGDGEFAVALRSALIDGRRMSVRAGAGIVAASDPGLEYAETEAKLMALLRSAGIETAD